MKTTFVLLTLFMISVCGCLEGPLNVITAKQVDRIEDKCEPEYDYKIKDGHYVTTLKVDKICADRILYNDPDMHKTEADRIVWDTTVEAMVKDTRAGNASYLEKTVRLKATVSVNGFKDNIGVNRDYFYLQLETSDPWIFFRIYHPKLYKNERFPHKVGKEYDFKLRIIRQSEYGRPEWYIMANLADK